MDNVFLMSSPPFPVWTMSVEPAHFAAKTSLDFILRLTSGLFQRFLIMLGAILLVFGITYIPGFLVKTVSTTEILHYSDLLRIL